MPTFISVHVTKAMSRITKKKTILGCIPNRQLENYNLVKPVKCELGSHAEGSVSAINRLGSSIRGAKTKDNSSLGVCNARFVGYVDNG